MIGLFQKYILKGFTNDGYLREKRKDEYLYILDFSWVYMASVDSGQVYGSTKIAY